MENIFVLNEAFEDAYLEFLAEKDAREEKELFNSLSEAIVEAESTMKLLEDYFAAADAETLSENTDVLGLVSQLAKRIEDINVKNGFYADPSSDKKLEYETKGGALNMGAKYEDLKFTKRIVIFIKALIAWIKNTFLFLLGKIGAFIKSALHLFKPTDKKEDLAVSYKKMSALIEDVMAKSVKVEKYGLPAIGQDSKVYKVYSTEAKINEAVEVLEEEEKKEGGEKDGKEKREPTPGKTRNILTIDLTKDVIALRELLAHFFNLFDNAQGSSNEELFGVDDLKILLRIFAQTIKGLENGVVPAYELDGSYGEVAAIDSSVTRDTLVNTKLNLEQLKEAYTNTSSRIMDIGQILGHKQLILGAQLGSYMSLYSSGTCKEVINLIRAVEPRIKDVEKKEAALTIVQKAYVEVVKKLQKMAQSYQAIGMIGYSTVYQRKISDLLQASKFLLQTVGLRLTGLTLYAKQLKDVNELLMNLLRVMGGNEKDIKIADKHEDESIQRIEKLLKEI